MKKTTILFLLLISTILISGCVNKVPLKSSEVAKCLTASGAKMYGTATCADCDDQKALFGEDFKNVPYIECDTTGAETCAKEGIRMYPTWIFGSGQISVGTISLEDISKMANCDITNKLRIKTEEPAASTTGTTPTTTDNSATTKPQVKSIYEGTYEGVFNYEYNPTCPHKKGIDKYGYHWSLADGTGWVSGVLKMRIKLGSIPAEPGMYSAGYGSPSFAYILNLWIDDPDFGTGPDGVAPIGNQYSDVRPTIIHLTALPRDPSDPIHKYIYEDPDTHKKTVIDSISSLIDEIYFEVPGTNMKSPDDVPPYILVYGAGRYSDGYYISDDGSVLHSYPHVPREGDGYTAGNNWAAYTSIGTGPFTTEYDSDRPGREGGCPTRFTSWSLTKISD